MKLKRESRTKPAPATRNDGDTATLAERAPAPTGEQPPTERADERGADEERTYTIDELAALSRVPSRTIRFYQAQKVLDRPERRGRVAVYTDAHVRRLELIGQLQDRGLRLSGMKQLLARRDRDDAVREWLGLSEALSRPWTSERPRTVDEAEMTRIIGDRPPGTLASALCSGLVRRTEEAPSTYLIPSQSLLDLSLSLLDAGLSIELLSEIEPLLRTGLRKTAESLVDFFVEHDELTGTDDQQQLGTLQALRSVGANAVGIIFAQEIERTLAALLEEGKPDPRTRKKRRK